MQLVMTARSITETSRGTMERLPSVSNVMAVLPPSAKGALDEVGVQIQPHHRVLANQPGALDQFLSMSVYVRSRSSLEAATRELAILATAWTLDSQYQKDTHTHLGRAAGLTIRELPALEHLPDGLAELEPPRAIVARYAFYIAQMRDTSEEVFAELQTYFSPPEVIDLTLTIGWYHLCAAVFGVLHVAVDEPLESAGD